MPRTGAGRLIVAFLTLSDLPSPKSHLKFSKDVFVPLTLHHEEITPVMKEDDDIDCVYNRKQNRTETVARRHSPSLLLIDMSSFTHLP